MQKLRIANIVQAGLSINGRSLQGILDRRHFHEDPSRISVIADNSALDYVDISLSDSPDGIEFNYLLPWKLFDGQLHRLKVVLDGSNESLHAQSFIGDPGLMTRAADIGESVMRTGDSHTSDKSNRAVLHALTLQNAALGAILNQLNAGHPDHAPSIASRAATTSKTKLVPLSYPDRYGPLVGKATVQGHGQPDLIWFSIIDWNFRIQRPQHLARSLADFGHRVFYLSVGFDWLDDRGRFEITGNPANRVFTIKLKLPPPTPVIYTGFPPETLKNLQAAVHELCEIMSIRNPIAVLQFPTWYDVAISIPGATVVYDCLDHIGGFSNVSSEALDREAMLLRNADMIVTTSTLLSEEVGATRANTLIRNAAEVSFFAKDPGTGPLNGKKPIIGYFGAISEWFEIDWVAHTALKHPEWEFVLIGDSIGCDVSGVATIENISLLGEKPYAELPGYLHQFSAAIIPFKLTQLIQSTNPVKLYEYMSSGKPVIASAMPEVVAVGEIVAIAHSAEEFEAKIAQALLEDNDELRAARRAWAQNHTWASRADQFEEAIFGTFVPVSVVVLCYNNWLYTTACLDSLLCFSDYPNLEIIVVDNASTDETAEQLQRLARRESRIRVIRNDTNLGFSGGNNVGIEAAGGDIVVLINNDTYVTKGWVRDLIRPLLLDSNIGMAGPLTNNIGNEQKVAAVYKDMGEMQIFASELTGKYKRQLLETNNLAFFCVAIRKEVIEKVGLLDDDFGVGFFEDDDYCNRVIESGYQLVVVDDVFIHHHLSASFSQLGEKERNKQFARNKEIFEKKWGRPWTPHKYRAKDGFG